MAEQVSSAGYLGKAYCEKCLRKYRATTKFCEFDGTPLTPVAGASEMRANWRRMHAHPFRAAFGLLVTFAMNLFALVFPIQELLINRLSGFTWLAAGLFTLLGMCTAIGSALGALYFLAAGLFGPSVSVSLSPSSASGQREEAGIIRLSLLMLILSVPLSILPFGGPFLVGGIGGVLAKSPTRAILASLLPTVASFLILTAIGEALPIGRFFGGSIEAVMFSILLALSIPLIVGAFLGGLIGKFLGPKSR